MLPFMQIVQISLFAACILGVFTLGLLILVKPILILPRRWFLVIFVPLLAANPLALLEELILPGSSASVDWRLWIILAVDLVFAAAAFVIFRGWQVYGLSKQEIEGALGTWCTQQTWQFEAHDAEKKTLWGGSRTATCIHITRESQVFTLWIIDQGSETRLEVETPHARRFLRSILPDLQRVGKPYHLQDHLSGILYIILAVVLAVMAWIFFFEPRLILIE